MPLVQFDTEVLTVAEISKITGISSWSVNAALNRTPQHPEYLRGEKAKGEGLAGHGGQWQVRVNDYLAWVGFPDEDRRFIDEDTGLPELHSFEDVAADLGIEVDDLIRFVTLFRKNHMKVGRRRWFSHLQRKGAEEAYRSAQKTSGTRPWVQK